MSLQNLSKPTECTIPRMNPNINYGLWVIMMFQCRFIICNKRTTLVGDIDNEGGCALAGAGCWEGGCPEDTWEISVPSSQFCCEPKIVLKN